MELGLTDKTVFVAGSSRGIGLAISRAFLNEGAFVVVTGRDSETLHAAYTALAAAAGDSRVLSICADLTNDNDIRQALMTAAAKFGHIDAVVANVGSGSGPTGWDLTIGDWDTALRWNFTGGALLASAALPYLIAQHGTLTFVSSIAGVEAINAPMPYSAAKAAIQSFVNALSRLVGPRGVRVNAVAPGNILFPGGSWELKLAHRREFFDHFVRTEVPLQRFGQPEEIADAVVFLASERASFITGSCLVVDGGQTRTT